MGKNKTMDFSETIVVYDLKLATDDRSDKKFLFTSNFVPRGYIKGVKKVRSAIKLIFF